MPRDGDNLLSAFPQAGALGEEQRHLLVQGRLLTRQGEHPLVGLRR